jgi:hypothetical protein
VLGWVHLVRRPLFGLLYQSRMIDDDKCGVVDGMRISRGNRITEKICPSITWSTTNPIWPDLISKRSCRGQKLATDHLSYGTAHISVTSGKWSSTLKTFVQIINKWPLKETIHDKKYMYLMKAYKFIWTFYFVMNIWLTQSRTFSDSHCMTRPWLLGGCGGLWIWMY